MRTLSFLAVGVVGIIVLIVLWGAKIGPFNQTGAAEAAIRSQLKDPASALFENVTRQGNWVCGRVNAKNGFGAYSGAEPFSVEIIEGRAARAELWSSLDENQIADRMARCPPTASASETDAVLAKLRADANQD